MTHNPSSDRIRSYHAIPWLDQKIRMARSRRQHPELTDEAVAARVCETFKDAPANDPVAGDLIQEIIMGQPILLPGLLTEAGAAAYLGISPSKLRELPIPRRKLGRKRLYDRRDLENYIDTLPYEGEDEAGDEGQCDAAFV